MRVPSHGWQAKSLTMETCSRGLGVEISFSREVAMKEISILQEDADKISTLKIEYQSGGEWKELKTVNDARSQRKSGGGRSDGFRHPPDKRRRGYREVVALYEVSVTELSAADAEHVYTDMGETDFTASVGEENASLFRRQGYAGARQLNRDRPEGDPGAGFDRR